MRDSLSAFRLAYYVGVAAVAVAAHQTVVVDVVGNSAGGFLRRNSEAYVLMLLIPAYWEVIRLWRPLPPTQSELLRWASWHVTLIVAVIILQTDFVSAVDAPQSAVTLGEAFLATGVVSLYFDWSRGGLPGPQWGRPPVTRRRIWYYVGAIAVAVLAHQEFVRSLIGDGVTDWLQVNAEAFAAIVLIPLYFDVVRPAAVSATHRWLVAGAWYLLLAGVPLFVQSRAADSVLGASLSGWIGQTTEAFLATIFVSLYFDVVRGKDRVVPAAGGGATVADSVLSPDG